MYLFLPSALSVTIALTLENKIQAQNMQRNVRFRSEHSVKKLEKIIVIKSV